jgi:endoglucanase
MLHSDLRVGSSPGRFLAVVCALAASAALTASALAAGSGSQNVRMGAYDPYGTFSRDSKISIEHIFVPWQDFNLASLNTVDQYARTRGRSLLITVEPWTWSYDNRTQTPAKLFAGIIAGNYDHFIRDFCRESASLKSAVTIRWGHEMDLGHDRYPWSAWAPDEYVQAYRHFVDTCRAAGEGLRFMWSPRGEPSLQDYYPGSDYVDNIGLTMFGFQKYEIALYGKGLSLTERLGSSYELVTDYGKDIYITEFGCHGDRDYMKRCLDEARTVSTAFSRIKGIIYYNEVETHPWPGTNGMPDWRVMSKLFAGLPR